MTARLLNFPQRPAIETPERIITQKTLEDWFDDIPTLTEPPANLIPFPQVGQTKIGVFSDKRMYAAFLRDEISRERVTLHCLLSPQEFKKSRMPFFDQATAWILCLTGEERSYEAFLEAFLDHYGEKDVLYIFNKTSRTAMSDKIRQYLRERT